MANTSRQICAKPSLTYSIIYPSLHSSLYFLHSFTSRPSPSPLPPFSFHSFQTTWVIRSPYRDRVYLSYHTVTDTYRRLLQSIRLTCSHSNRYIEKTTPKHKAYLCSHSIYLHEILVSEP